MGFYSYSFVDTDDDDRSPAGDPCQQRVQRLPGRGDRGARTVPTHGYTDALERRLAEGRDGLMELHQPRRRHRRLHRPVAQDLDYSADEADGGRGQQPGFQRRVGSPGRLIDTEISSGSATSRVMNWQEFSRSLTGWASSSGGTARSSASPGQATPCSSSSKSEAGSVISTTPVNSASRSTKFNGAGKIADRRLPADGPADRRYWRVTPTGSPD